MILLDTATARANVLAMLTHLDDDETREAFRGLRVANRIAVNLSARIDALKCDGQGRSAIVDALIQDPAALTLCAEMFSVLSIGSGWQIAGE
jgi:ABC-type lipoprotein export system ATPase subunit